MYPDWYQKEIEISRKRGDRYNKSADARRSAVSYFANILASGDLHEISRYLCNTNIQKNADLHKIPYPAFLDMIEKRARRLSIERKHPKKPQPEGKYDLLKILTKAGY